MNKINIFLSVILFSLNGLAGQKREIVSCHRAAGDTNYQIQVFQTSEWDHIGKGNFNANAVVEVVRATPGKKSVRNYPKTIIQKRVGFLKDIYVLLQKNNRTDYGSIEFNVRTKDRSKVTKIMAATLNLSDAQNEKLLELTCLPTADFSIPK